MTQFRPARWLPGRHLQTVFSALFRRAVRLPLRRERWELADGDFVDVDHLEPSGARPGIAPVLIALHGLEGSSGATYLRGLLAQAQRRGFRAVALNFRSCSGEPNRLPRSYHSGETRDLDECVRRVRARNPGAALLLCGFSLGGNVLVKWLGEEGASVPPEVRGAAAISNPFDLALCAGALDGPGLMARLYRTRFLRSLKRKTEQKAGRFPGAVDLARLRSARTLVEFDEHVTAPLHGFRGAADYYERCSSAQFLPQVAVPLLLVSSEDDPFIPPVALPHALVRRNPRVTLEVTREGGHVGFIGGPLFQPRYYAEERAVEFLAGCLDARAAADAAQAAPAGTDEKGGPASREAARPESDR